MRMRFFEAFCLCMCILVCADAVTPEVLGLFATNAQVSHLKAATSRCYSTTLDDDQMRTAVWWTKPKIGFLLEPHRGFPHLKASVYDCPSNGGRVVYEYMSTTMTNDARLAGTQVPEYWQWPGDVEALVVDLTHRVFFVEIFDFDPAAANSPHFLYPSASYPAEFRISAYIFDESNSTIDTFTPLKSLPQWDKRISRLQKVEGADSVFAAGMDDPRSVIIQWYLPGSNEQFSYPIVETDYEFQVYTVDITSYIGSSVQGDATKLVIPASVNGTAVCPSGAPCSTSNCRSCSEKFPLCPRQYLTDCTEATMDIAKLQKVLSAYNQHSFTQAANGTKISFEAFLKNPTKWTVWTAGGLQLTANWVSQSGEVWHGGDRTQASKWFAVAELLRVRGNNQKVQLSLSGLKNDNNNVYIINVNARKKSTGETTPLHMMTLQMRTPVYDSPAMVPRDAGVIIGISAGLGASIIVFLAVAIFIRVKRKMKASSVGGKQRRS